MRKDHIIKNFIGFSLILFTLMFFNNIGFCENKEDFWEPRKWSELEIALIIADIKMSKDNELIYDSFIATSKNGKQRIIVQVLLETSSGEVNEWKQKLFQAKRDYFEDLYDGYVAIIKARIPSFKPKKLDMFFFCNNKTNKVFFQGVSTSSQVIIIDKWIDLDATSESLINEAMKLVLEKIKTDSNTKREN